MASERVGPHVIDLEAVDDQLSLCRLRPPGGADLAPYERRIRSYLDALATDGVVPAPALGEGVIKPAAWWRKLRGEVVADARARGLSWTASSPGGSSARPAASTGSSRRERAGRDEVTRSFGKIHIRHSERTRGAVRTLRLRHALFPR